MRVGRISEKEKTLARLVPGILFSLAKPEFLSQLVSGYLHLWILSTCFTL
jgi:hypothetical protein